MTYLVVIIFGLIVGSFLNAAIWRLREGLSIVRDRSMCPHCRKYLAWHDLVPILSYLMLGGVCRSCSKPISWQYPLVEAATAVLFLLFFIHDQGAPQMALLLIRDWFMVAVGIFLFIYDLRWYELPDVITLPAIAIVYLLSGIIFSPSLSCQGFECILINPWLSFLVAAIIGAGFFFLQYVISRGKWIGGGDIRLGAFMGAFLGFPGILIALFISYLTGSIIGLGLIVGKKKKMSSEIPFGPFLILGTMVTALLQPSINTFFLNLI